MKKNYILLLLLFLFSYWANSQHLEESLLLAAKNNASLKAYFNEYLAAQEAVSQVGTLPDPELAFGYFIQPMEYAMGTQRAEISLMQRFPWFGMLSKQKDEAAKAANVKYEAFRQAKNQLFFEVKETWHELQRLEEQIKLIKENIELLQTLERLALARFQSAATDENMSSANVGMADVLLMQIEIKESENELFTLEDSKKPLAYKFNRLLNRELTEKVIIEDSLVQQPLPSYFLTWEDSILLNSPVLKTIDAEKEMYKIQGEKVKLEGRPTIGIGLEYMIFSPNKGEMAMGGENMIMPMVSLNLPIYRKKYKSMAKGIQLQETAVDLQREDTANDMKVQWQESLRDLKTIERDIILYAEQAALAQQALEIKVRSYASNGSAFEDILRLQQQLLNYKLKTVNALATQNIAVAKLALLSASDLTLDQ